jgi:hypothetical protein
MKKIIYALCISTITASIIGYDLPPNVNTQLIAMTGNIVKKELFQLKGKSIAWRPLSRGYLNTFIQLFSCGKFGKNDLPYSVKVTYISNDTVNLESLNKNNNRKLSYNNSKSILEALKAVYKKDLSNMPDHLAYCKSWNTKQKLQLKKRP